LNRPQHSYVPTLDGWRAVAILAVIVCHGGNAVFSDGGLLPSQVLFNLTRRGALGVDVFFAISGILICGRLLEEERQTGSTNLRNFYLRRAFRILPAAILYLLVLGILSMAGAIFVGRVDWFASLCFFRNYTSSFSSGWYTAHFWSLAVEEHFYLILPGLLLLFGGRSAKKIIVGLAIAIAMWRSLDFHYLWLSHVLSSPSFYERTDIRLDALLWGAWMAMEMSNPDHRTFMTRYLSLPIWFLAIAGYINCVGYSPPLALMWEAILIPIVLAGTILHGQAVLGRFLELGLLRWVGRISYGLYLWQQLFLPPAWLEHGLGALQAFPLNVFALFVCATASYYLLERPLIALRRRIEEGGEPFNVFVNAQRPHEFIQDQAGL
jgi:peptidoglycan/LPS O-acetylase OafA/YrhL